MDRLLSLNINRKIKHNSFLLCQNLSRINLCSNHEVQEHNIRLLSYLLFSWHNSIFFPYFLEKFVIYLVNVYQTLHTLSFKLIQKILVHQVKSIRKPIRLLFLSLLYLNTLIKLRMFCFCFQLEGLLGTRILMRLC